jgi:DNA-binding MarR family transcriptional regulator
MDAKLGYIVILPWMREELDLKGNELLVYALIHGFSQEAQGCFFGSLNYICRACGCTIPTTVEVLKKLQKRGLIHKRELSENNVKMCQYTAIKGSTKEILVPLKNLKGGTKEILVGGTKESLDNNKTTIDNKKTIKSENTPAPLILPFSSDKFRMTWEALCEEKEWKKKTRNALQLTLNKLAKYHEDFAIELMEATIESGKWQRVVFPDTDAKYQEWKSARQQRMDNQTPRTAVMNKPRQLPADNNVDAMYAKLRAKREAEERELREQLQAQYGDTYRPSGGQDDR